MPNRITIVGTGDMAHALCHLFHNHNTGDQFSLAITRGKNTTPRRLEGDKEEPTALPSFLQHFPDIIPLIDTLDQALMETDILILAIPATSYLDFVESNSAKFRSDVILVDISNDGYGGLDHLAVSLRWVKALGDVGAGDVLLGKPWNKQPLVTAICGQDSEAVLRVGDMAQKAFGFDRVKMVPFSKFSSHFIRDQGELPQDWVQAIRVLLFLFCCTEGYAILRYNVFKGFEWFHLPLQVTNKAVCWTTLTSFTLTLLPGVLVRLYKKKSKQLPLHPLILRGLQIRKPLGLLSFWLLGLHVLISSLIFSPAYYGKFFVDPTANHSKLNATGELSFFFAIAGTSLYVVLGICSVPSVAIDMTRRVWHLIYGPIAWTALFFATLHVYIMGDHWLQPQTWPGGLPPITLLGCIPPVAIMVMNTMHVATSTLTPTSSQGVFDKTSSRAPIKCSTDEDDVEMEDTKALIQINNLLLAGNSSDGKDK